MCSHLRGENTSVHVCLYKNRKKPGEIHTKLFTVDTSEEWVGGEVKRVFYFYFYTSVVFKLKCCVYLSVNSECHFVIFLAGRKSSG